MIVEYDGTDFSGWQIQPAKRTVQDVIQQTLIQYCRQQIKLIGSGRTDAGVHAVGQVCSFHTDTYFEPGQMMYRLNRMLPADVAVKKIGRAINGFDPRRNATSRTYRYSIAEAPGPLYRHIQFQAYRRLDLDVLNQAAVLFKGQHDFTSFCKRKSLKENNRCHVTVSRWFRYREALIYEVAADRFLHHMVRRMVGTMLAFESSRISLTHIRSFLNNKENVRFNSPANGLTLIRVRYGRKRK
jgi:tRNA pseudouridine38-40 synthase